MTFAEWEEERSKGVAIIEAAKKSHHETRLLLETLVAGPAYDAILMALDAITSVLDAARSVLREHEKKRPT